MAGYYEYHYAIIVYVVQIALAGCTFGLLFYGLVTAKSSLVFRFSSPLNWKLTVLRILIMGAMLFALAKTYHQLNLVVLHDGNDVLIGGSDLWTFINIMLWLVMLFPVNWPQHNALAKTGDESQSEVPARR